MHMDMTLFVLNLTYQQIDETKKQSFIAKQQQCVFICMIHIEFQLIVFDEK